MKQLVSSTRIRSVIAGAITERDATDALRRHRIRYTFSTEGGVFHIKIPCRSGAIRIIRTASRSAPLVIIPPSATIRPVPVTLPYYD